MKILLLEFSIIFGKVLSSLAFEIETGWYTMCLVFPYCIVDGSGVKFLHSNATNLMFFIVECCPRLIAKVPAY